MAHGHLTERGDSPDLERPTAAVADAASADTAPSRTTRARIALLPRFSEHCCGLRRATNETAAAEARRLGAIRAVRAQGG